MNKKKIALICGNTFTVIKFRYDLVQKLIKNNFEVSIIALDDKYKNDILTWGVDFYCVNSTNTSINPFEKLKLINKIKEALMVIKPDIVLAFQTTPIICGQLAARKLNIETIYSKVEGVGDVFIYNTLYWRIIRIFTSVLYKTAFKLSKKVIFENNDDANEFLSRKLLRKDQIEIIPCVGVDVEKYYYSPIKNTNTFVMISRMKKSKGVIEFCEAARIVKQKYPDTVFNYIGNEFSLFVNDIKDYIEDGSINYLGYQENVIPFIEDSFVHVLPSYGEGFGLITVQTAAMGRPSIVTDVSGSRDAVVNKKTGLFVKVKDSQDLAEKIIYAINNKEEMIEMGKNARKFVIENFEKDRVNEKVVKVLLNEK